MNELRGQVLAESWERVRENHKKQKKDFGQKSDNGDKGLKMGTGEEQIGREGEKEEGKVCAERQDGRR